MVRGAFEGLVGVGLNDPRAAIEGCTEAPGRVPRNAERPVGNRYLHTLRPKITTRNARVTER
jgi:hypothetical protein